MTPLETFWLVLGGVSILMLGVTRLSLYSLKDGGRPVRRIVLAHLIAVVLIAVIGGLDMPYLSGWVRWGYAFALCGFGTAPWLAMDLIRLRFRRGGAQSTPSTPFGSPSPRGGGE